MNQEANEEAGNIMQGEAHMKLEREGHNRVFNQNQNEKKEQ